MAGTTAGGPGGGMADGARAARGMQRLLFVSRRGLLRAGLFGTGAVWLGGLLACTPDRTARSSATPSRVALSPAGEEILRAICPVVLGGLLPEAGPERARVFAAGIADLDQYIAHLSSPLQRELHDVFATLDLLPVRLLLTGGFARWSETKPEALESCLRFARNSRSRLLRRVYALLQSLVVLSFFDQAVAWEGIGYPGPPIARPDGRWVNP